jgi:hypothetical protein
MTGHGVAGCVLVVLHGLVHLVLHGHKDVGRARVERASSLSVTISKALAWLKAFL